MEKFLLTILLTSFFFGTSPYARTQEGVDGLTQHTWRTEDGLPDQEIQAIVQTADHFLWLGTPHGLVRFDGYHFRDEINTRVPMLRQFGVSCLLAARDGSLWVGANNGGIVRITPDGVRIFALGDGRGTLTVRVLYEDRSGDIWTGTDHGIFRLKEDRFQSVPGLKDPSVSAIVADGAGGLWFGGHRLLHYQANRFQEIAVPRQQGGLRIRSLSQAADGTLWIGTSYGLLQRTEAGVLQTVPDAPWDVRNMLQDSRGRLWIATAGNGLLVSRGDLKFVPVGPTEAHVSRVILALALDTDRDLWIGTQAGLTRFSDSGMTLWDVSSAVKTDFASVFLDRDGSVWLNAGDVTRLVEGKQTSLHFPSLGSFRIRSVLRAAQGALWVGTMGHGAYRFGSGKVENHSSDLGTGYVRGFLQGEGNSIWIATDSGVALWRDGAATSYQRSARAPHQPVYSMALAPKGGLWTGTANGLFLLRDGQYQDCAPCTLLGQQRVWSLFREAEDRLWIGAESGLYLLSGDRLRRLVLPDQGSTTQAVLSVLKDARGRLLVAQPGTIFRFSPAEVAESQPMTKQGRGEAMRTMRLEHLPEIFSVSRETATELSGGLPANGQTDQEGGAWYGTHLGLLHLSADRAAITQAPPPVNIEQITVDGTPVATTRSLTLMPSTHNLQIMASPVLLSSRRGLQIRRRLLGLEDRWSELEPGASSSYSGLPAGTYHFQVETRWPDDDRVFQDELEIVQIGPLWQRPWFLLLCALAVPLAAWAWHAFRIRQIALRFQAVAEERNRVAREMHDTLLQGCIGVSSLLEAASLNESPMTSVEGNALQVRSPLQYAREEVTKTIQDARAAISDLRRTEELRELGAELDALIRQQPRGSNLRIAFTRSGPEITLQPSVQHELFMSTREAIFNAVAHADATSLHVKLQTSSTRLAIDVVDDGKGFDPVERSQSSGHFGLVSMYERLQRIGGSIDIHSGEGRGSTVRLILPLQARMVRRTTVKTD
ncbi:Histidine kinase-, DNA gyrase B-, and HSP90-like ATPase [Granulicella pectinivorans]|uniref:histidine kinase n=1 Tax=Granulicella pectinivorans TaxID=474950 RepID=A0A1I6LY07_9BACT|nr:sensor histidine kinase [Granulicella pectinivorans]SFS08285.1 Histidine kinase-, DNA gyrase B-, and HSP90-like ATPase [Granulicella pectinivorans]